LITAFPSLDSRGIQAATAADDFGGGKILALDALGERRCGRPKKRSAATVPIPPHALRFTGVFPAPPTLPRAGVNL